MLPSMAETAASALPVLIVWAAAADICKGSIPNSMVLLLVACFAVFAATAGMNAGQVLSHVLCACAILTGGFVLFSGGLIGGGDAKLLASAALWFGFKSILPFLASVALAGGLLSLAYLSVNEIRVQLGGTAARPTTVRYGVAIAAGALAAIPDWLASF